MGDNQNLPCAPPTSLPTCGVLVFLGFVVACDYGLATGSSTESQEGAQLTQYIARLWRAPQQLKYLRLDQVRGVLVQDDPSRDGMEAGTARENQELVHFGALQTPDGIRLQIDISPYPRFVVLNPQDIADPQAESHVMHLSPRTLSVYQNCPLYRLGHARLERTSVNPTPSRLWTYEDEPGGYFGLVQTLSAGQDHPLWVARACIANVADPILDDGIPDLNTVDGFAARTVDGLMLAYPRSEPQRLKTELVSRGWTETSPNSALAAFLDRNGIVADAWYALPNRALPVALLPRSSFETLYNNGAITPYLNENLSPSNSHTRLGLSPQVSPTVWQHIHGRHNSFHRFFQQMRRATYESEPPESIMVVTGYYTLTGVLITTILDWDEPSHSYTQLSRPNGGPNLRTAFPLSWGYYKIDHELGELLRWLRAEPVTNWSKLTEFQAQTTNSDGTQRYRFKTSQQIRGQVYIWSFFVVDVPSTNNVDAAKVVSFFPQDTFSLEHIDLADADRDAYLYKLAHDLTEKRQQGQHVPSFIFDDIKTYLGQKQSGFGLPPGF